MTLFRTRGFVVVAPTCTTVRFQLLKMTQPIMCNVYVLYVRTLLITEESNRCLKALFSLK